LPSKRFGTGTPVDSLERLKYQEGFANVASADKKNNLAAWESVFYKVAPFYSVTLE
jgi:hypothetical protein